MTAKQLNVRLPAVIIDDINFLSNTYGSQAKVLIAAVTNLRKEVEMKALIALEDISNAKDEDEMRDAAARALKALQGLPPAEQEEVAKNEFLRFRQFIDDHIKK